VSETGTFLRHRVPLFAAALWWGSLTAIGFIAVPLLFVNLPNASLAGSVAGRLFTAQAWVSVACGVLLLFSSRGRDEPARMNWAGGALLFVIAGLLLALISEFGVAPRIIARENLRLWHSLGSVIYLVQWLCAAVVLWKLTPVRSSDLS
jgi:uncharacterized membrane protein